MHSRVVTTRAPTQRTQARPQQALRPVNYENEGERILGGISREEARHQQTLKYKEDSKKFAEKEKEKAQKKKEEKWKRYSHVDVGQRLNADSLEFDDDVEFIRVQQQLMYDEESTNGLELERQREADRLRREERRKEEKLKKYSNVSRGQQFGSSERVTDEGLESIAKARQQLQSEYKAKSTEGLQREQQKEAAKLKREQQTRDLKLRRYEHVNVGSRLSGGAVTSSISRCSKGSSCLSADEVERESDDINFNVNYDRAMEEKTKHYRGQKLATQNVASSSGLSSSQMNNLNAITETETESIVVPSQADKENEHRERMRLARERLQKKYDEELHKSS